MFETIKRTALIALIAVYAVTGAMFVSAMNAGGISLGLMFIGGAVLLRFAMRYERHLNDVRALLATIARQQEKRRLDSPTVEDPNHVDTSFQTARRHTHGDVPLFDEPGLR